MYEEADENKRFKSIPPLPVTILLSCFQSLCGALVMYACACCVLQKVDVTSKAVVEVISKTSEYLQPNPGEKREKPCLHAFIETV